VLDGFHAGMSIAAGLETLRDDEDLRIRFERGDSDEAVVSFSGVGGQDYRVEGIARPQHEEFRKTIGSARKSVYYVIDTRRRWYNGIEFKLAGVLNDDIVKQNFRRVTALGNSMGGTGALMFADVIVNCRTAIAFAPQSSVHPEIVPFETRWFEYRDAISRWTTPDPLNMLSERVRYHVFFGADDHADRWHMRRILELRMRSVVVYAIRACQHDVAMFLRERGALKDVILAAIDGRPKDVRSALKGVSYKRLRRFETTGKEAVAAISG
jgi:hypothetical protein